MFAINAFDDTIAAISTPPGEGGIGIVRLSGSDAIRIAGRIFRSPKNRKLTGTESHRIIYGFIIDPSTNATIDEVLVSIMHAPNTYTREDIVEINCHGGLLPLRKALELVLNNGARLAEPGEFTRRAFLSGRIDLSQAEAVIDIIKAKTEASRKVAIEQLSGSLSEKITSLRDSITKLCAQIEAYIDFPEDDIEPASKDLISDRVRSVRHELSLLSESFEEGRFFREGIKVAIVGKPNVGKSSLLNALLKRDRAIVTEMPGTTRDVLEEYLNIKGLPVRIMDTAGIRETHEMAEREGVLRSLRAIEDADIVIGVIDGSRHLSDEDLNVLSRLRDYKIIIALNKSDLSPAEDIIKKLEAYSGNIVMLSAKTGFGLDILKERIVDVAIKHPSSSNLSVSHETAAGILVTNVRHKTAIDNAIKALDRTSEVLVSRRPLEIVAIELRDALDRLGEIVGAVTTEDILNTVFSEFCIGK